MSRNVTEQVLHLNKNFLKQPFAKLAIIVKDNQLNKDFCG